MNSSGDREKGIGISEREPETGSERLQGVGTVSPALGASARRVAKRRGYVVVDEERCKGCELCVQVCPEGALELLPALNSFAYHPACLKEDNSCTGCALCAQVCPDVALEVYRE